MQWFRVEMAPVASSIAVLDTQRQLIVLHFENRLLNCDGNAFHVCHTVLCVVAAY